MRLFQHMLRKYPIYYILLFFFVSSPIHAQVVDFEDPDWMQQQAPRIIEEDIVSPQEALVDTVTNHLLVFAIEQQTLALYPDIQQRIQNTVTNMNNRLTQAGILRSWSIDHFAPTYNKTSRTSCSAANPNGGYLPTEYCSHSASYVFIAVDETTGSNYSIASIPSLEWHGYNGLWGSQGESVMVHELGHTLGLPDMYHISVNPENNLVNGQAYKPFQGYIMHNLTPGNYHPWDVEMVNRARTTLPIPWNAWTVYQTTNHQIKIVNAGRPVVGASVQVYASNPSQATGGRIDTTAEYQGTTNSQGIINLGQSILGTNDFLALKAFLIKVTLNNQTEYFWMDITDVNEQFWSGATTSVYEFSSVLGVFPTPSPSIFPTPTPTILPSPTPAPEDLNQDGAVNSADLRIGITNFINGQMGCLNFADFNDDCKVNILDSSWIIRRMN